MTIDNPTVQPVRSRLNRIDQAFHNQKICLNEKFDRMMLESNNRFAAEHEKLDVTIRWMISMIVAVVLAIFIQPRV